MAEGGIDDVEGEDEAGQEYAFGDVVDGAFVAPACYLIAYGVEAHEVFALEGVLGCDVVAPVGFGEPSFFAGHGVEVVDEVGVELGCGWGLEVASCEDFAPDAEVVACQGEVSCLIECLAHSGAACKTVEHAVDVGESAHEGDDVWE